MMSARAFLSGIIDYAGLFPPARLRMDDAVREFARSTRGNDRDLLGRFILPVSRLNEFSATAHEFLTDNAEPWRLSAIASSGNDSELNSIVTFNHARASQTGGALIDAIEIPVTTSAEVEWAADAYGKQFAVFLEPTQPDDSVALLTQIARSGVSAKLRTGGVVASSIPSATSVMRFIDTCARLSLPFKATAGLHHAVRGDYPLTYETDAPKGTMFGYLNIFLVAAFHRAGLPESALFDLLEESDPSSITFDDAGAWWRGNLADTAQLGETRKSLAVSFGSCSFTEPVDEAKGMHLI